MDVTGLPLFSLKGCHKKAQGIALGPRRQQQGPSPERAQQNLARLVVAPFQGNHSYTISPPQGVALGCPVWPLRGIGAGNRSRLWVMRRSRCCILQSRNAATVVAPFQGNHSYTISPPQGVALGCPVWPLRGIGAGNRSRLWVMRRSRCCILQSRNAATVV